MYGNNPFPGLCQQVRLLLETSLEPSGNGMALEDGISRIHHVSSSFTLDNIMSEFFSFPLIDQVHLNNMPKWSISSEVSCSKNSKSPWINLWKWTENKDISPWKYQLIYLTSIGVPGVLPERLEEGMNPRHCALSLVGEPIMYPEINRFLRLLSDKSISSFLVTNAQFPEAIRQLDPCTQLYVSVDASTRDSLKKIDRPLFKGYYSSSFLCFFLLCMQYLSELL